MQNTRRFKNRPKLDKPKFSFSYDSALKAVQETRNWVITQVNALRTGPGVRTVTPLECTVLSEFEAQELRREGNEKQVLLSGSHVKIDFYLNISGIYFEKAPDSSWYLPRMKSGDVDLSPLVNIYGVPNLQVVDPMRWIEFKPARPFTLSPLAVEALRLNDPERGILITESSVPFVTRCQRNIRIAFLICFFLTYSLFHLAFYGGLERRNVPVPLGNHFWSVYGFAKQSRQFMVSTKDFVVENWEKVALTFILTFLFFCA